MRRSPETSRCVVPCRSALLAIALGLAGCTAAPLAPSVPADAADTPSAAASAEPSPKPEEAPKPPPPRTLPQALSAYWRCLHSPPKEDDQSRNGANSEKPDKPEKPKEEKSPPAAGEPAKDQANGTKGDAKEGNGADKDKTDGDKDKADAEKNKKSEAEESWYSAHAQATMVTQIHPNFHALYTGPLSLLPRHEAATSMTGTLFLDARLWECGSYSGELVFNPEISGGRGFSGVNGVAGFPNGEITRVGVVEPTPYLARLFLRQTWGLGGEQEKVEDEANQIAGRRDVERLTLVVGKLAATDLVDNNQYSHDPRTQFLNWSVMYNGAWDYPANVRGYTYGIGLDFNQKYWALRYGIFAEPEFANGAPLDPHFLKANGQVVELEGRYSLWEAPGKVRVMTYLNRAHMGDYREALEEMPIDPNVTLTRSYRYKYGFGLSAEQQLTKDLGAFARLGWNDGRTESWAFTPIDRTACLGFLLNGRCWCRAKDQVGLAGAINGISLDHRGYLASGGLDFNLGDGRLNYGYEEILETYYDCQVVKGMFVTADFQEINHPAYNRDRGPVAVMTLRVHIEF